MFGFNRKKQDKEPNTNQKIQQLNQQQSDAKDEQAARYAEQQAKVEAERAAHKATVKPKQLNASTQDLSKSQIPSAQQQVVNFEYKQPTSTESILEGTHYNVNDINRLVKMQYTGELWVVMYPASSSYDTKVIDLFAINSPRDGEEERYYKAVTNTDAYTIKVYIQAGYDDTNLDFYIDNLVIQSIVEHIYLNGNNTAIPVLELGIINKYYSMSTIGKYMLDTQEKVVYVLNAYGLSSEINDSSWALNDLAGELAVKSLSNDTDMSFNIHGKARKLVNAFIKYNEDTDTTVVASTDANFDIKYNEYKGKLPLSAVYINTMNTNPEFIFDTNGLKELKHATFKSDSVVEQTKEQIKQLKNSDVKNNMIVSYLGIFFRQNNSSLKPDGKMLTGWYKPFRK